MRPLRTAGPVSPWLTKPARPGEIIGWRKDGRPIWLQGGGSGPTLVQSKPATGTSGTSLSATLTSATTAGNCLIVCFGSIDSTANPTISGITLGGSAGNFASSNTAYNNTDNNAAIWADPNCAGGQTSVALTLTGDSGGSPETAALVMEWSGLLTSSVLDKHPTGSNGNATTTWTSNSSGTLSQASELAIGVAAFDGSGTVTGPSSPWTEMTQVGSIAAMLLVVGYQVTTSTAAVTYNGTNSSSSSEYGCCMATFKASSAAAPAGALLALFP